MQIENRVGLLRVFITLCCVVYAYAAQARTYSERFTDGVGFALEEYVQNEYDADGANIRGEHGERVRIDLREDNLNWNHPGVIYETRLQAMLGMVYYEDEAPKSYLTSQSRHYSNTDYFGGAVEALVGQRYGYLFGTDMLEAQGGLNLESWMRNIRPTGSLRNIGRGVKELWGTASARATVGLINWWGPVRQRLQIGLKYPVLVFVANVDAESIVTLPAKSSLFGQFELGDIAGFYGYKLNIRVYVDSYRFGASNVAKSFYQDRTEIYSYGLHVTLY